MGWDYRSTFARPTVTEKQRRSLPRSLRRLVRFNPLGQNPVAPHATGPGSPSRKSFASFFSRRSAASASRSVIDVESPPALPPLPFGFPSPRPPAISHPSREFTQSNTDIFLRLQTMPPLFPPQSFQRSHRNSHTTMASEASETRSSKSVPGLVKFHYPCRSHPNRELPRDSSMPLPAPQAVSPGLWLKAKVLRRSHSTTTSEEKEGYRMGSDNGDESGGMEEIGVGLSGWKQV